MPKLKIQFPKMYRDRNQAISKHNGKRIYHGTWGTPEAEKSYKRFIAALLENPVIVLRRDETGDVLVSELADAFVEHVENSRMDKTDVGHVKRATGYLVDVYGELAVNEFSPKKLKVCRSQMVKAGTLCRKTISKYIGYIRRIFAWGVEEEVVPASVSHALKAVKDLRLGEEGTFDHPEREAVPDDVLRRTLPFLPPTVAAIVQVQWLYGMRPSEVLTMRVGDIDRSQKNGLWYYSPKHKTEEYIGKKPIPIGEAGQDLIAPYLIGKKPADSVFSPKTAQRERAAEARANRKSKLTPSQRERDAKRAETKASRVGEFYDHNAYRRAVKYAIEKANRHGVKIPTWSPYLLRNAAATAIELEYGLDEAQAQLGHTSANMTKRYSRAQLKQREKLARNRRNPFQSEEKKAG
jgi:integrase